MQIFQRLFRKIAGHRLLTGAVKAAAPDQAVPQLSERGHPLAERRSVRHFQIVQNYKVMPLVQHLLYIIGRVVDGDFFPQAGKQKCLMLCIKGHMGSLGDFSKGAAY